MNVVEVNVLVLAYLGDVIYESYVRHFLVESGISNVESLQKNSVSYVSAKAQASFLQELSNADFFTEEERNL